MLVSGLKRIDCKDLKPGDLFVLPWRNIDEDPRLCVCLWNVPSPADLMGSSQYMRNIGTIPCRGGLQDYDWVEDCEVCLPELSANDSQNLVDWA